MIIVRGKNIQQKLQSQAVQMRFDR